KRGSFMQAMALWEIIRKAKPTDEEAQHKAKDLAASATIAKGRYEEAIQAAKGGPPAETVTDHATTSTSPIHTPVEERAARDAAPLLAKVQADPTNATAYLHLASVYRRADMLEQTREVLQEGLDRTQHNF